MSGSHLESGLACELCMPLSFAWGGGELPGLWGFVGGTKSLEKGGGLMVDGVYSCEGPEIPEISWGGAVVPGDGFRGGEGGAGGDGQGSG